MDAVNCTELCLIILNQLANASFEYADNSLSTQDGGIGGDPTSAFRGSDSAAPRCSADSCSPWLQYKHGEAGLEFFVPGSRSATQRPKRPVHVPEAPLYIVLCVSILYIAIFIVGTTGNILVVLVVCRTHEMRNTTNFFLVNLSVADLLVILVCMPSAFVDIYSKEVWYLGPVMCKLCVCVCVCKGFLVK